MNVFPRGNLHVSLEILMENWEKLTALLALWKNLVKIDTITNQVGSSLAGRLRKACHYRVN